MYISHHGAEIKKHFVGGATVRQRQLKTVLFIIEQRRLQKATLAAAKLAGPSEAAHSASSASTASRDLGGPPEPKKAKTGGSEDRSAT